VHALVFDAIDALWSADPQGVHRQNFALHRGKLHLLGTTEWKARAAPQVPGG